MIDLCHSDSYMSRDDIVSYGNRKSSPFAYDVFVIADNVPKNFYL